MKIVINKEKKINAESIRREYSYRMTRCDKKIGEESTFFGIEIERRDYEGEKLIKIVRDGEQIVSNDYNKVSDMLQLAYDKEVSPIHFIDVFGEEIDKLAYEI